MGGIFVSTAHSIHSLYLIYSLYRIPVNLPFFIAIRYLRSRKKTKFISVMSLLAISGVTIGVAALTITLSVMNGFEKEVRERIIGADSHLRIFTYRPTGLENADSLRAHILNVKDVIGVSAFVQARGLLRYRQTTEGVVLRGIQPLTVTTVSDIKKQILFGDLDVKIDSLGLGGMILGNALAEKMGLSIGDTVYLLTTTQIQSFIPRMKPFVVRGIFSTGFYEYDNTIAYIDLQLASQLAGLPNQNVSGLDIKLSHYEKASAVAKELHQTIRFPQYILTWYEQNQTLFAWIQIEKWATFTILSLIILVAVVNIISSLVMLVLEKSKDIGILKAIGMSSTQIGAIFLWEGGIIGFIGSFLGSFLGFTFCYLQQTIGFFKLPGDVYFLDRMPIDMEFVDFLLVGLVAILLSLVAAYYPSRKASKLDPVQAIRGVE
ncbi:MAG: ABC transporter permease [bacterium]|nr:ABC transporter permease [bacterium]